MEEVKAKSVNFTAIGIVALLVVGGLGYNYTQGIKEKNAIEREKVESAERLKNEELRQEQEKANQKQEQDKKEYISKRKNDCLNIYKTEGAKWNNVTGWRYDEEDDECYIVYKESSPKTAAECDKIYPTKDDKGKLLTVFIHDNLLCKDGRFESSF